MMIAPWCGHCQNFAADYKKLARIFRGVIKVGAVDMTKQEVILSRHVLRYYRLLEQSLEYKDSQHFSSLLQGKSNHTNSMDNER